MLESTQITINNVQYGDDDEQLNDYTIIKAICITNSFLG